MLESIKNDLGENFNSSDSAVLKEILNKVTTNALFISNREDSPENVDLLEDEISECVKTIYLLRGSEDVKSQTQSGLSNTYKDAYETLRNNIIRNGKRRVR